MTHEQIMYKRLHDYDTETQSLLKFFQNKNFPNTRKKEYNNNSVERIKQN